MAVSLGEIPSKCTQESVYASRSWKGADKSGS
jgi:hypothetical protein